MQSSTEAGQNNGRRSCALAVVLVLLLGARLGLAALVYARPALAIANDSDRYIPIANAILNRTAYAWTTDHPGELLNTVGYPLFLAGVFAVAGSEAGHIALAQLILSGLLGIVLYLLLAARIGVPAAFLGMVLLALDPLTALWSMTILTETVFAVALGLAAGFLVAWSRSQNVTLLVLAGVSVGMACLVKPFALLVVALWAVCLVLFPEGRHGTRVARPMPGLQRAAIFAIPVVLLVGPWFLRNGVLWDCPTLSSVDRVTMRDYVAAKIVAETTQIELGQAQQELQADDPGVCPTQSSKYLNIVLENPGVYARLHLAGTVPVLIGTNFDRWMQYFGDEYTSPDLWRPYLDGGLRGLGRVLLAELVEFPRAVGLMIALTAFQGLLYLLAAAGALAAMRRSDGEYRWIALTLLCTVAILVLTPGQGGHERFRVPVQPLLGILISYGAAARLKRNRLPQSGESTRDAG